MLTPTDPEILKLADEHEVACLTADGTAVPAWREDTDITEHVLTFARALLALRDAPKPRTRDKTKAALAEIALGAPVAPTARKYGIQPSTLFRARAKLREAAQPVREAAQPVREAEARPSAPTPSSAGRRS